MTRYLFDTDMLTLLFRRHPAVAAAVARRPADELAVPIVTVQEVWDGWAAAARKARTPDRVGAAYDRLVATLDELKAWRVVSFPEPAVRRYADLKRQRLNIGAADLKIAATALEFGLVVVTRNRADFGRVPGLAVEDWAAD